MTGRFTSSAGVGLLCLFAVVAALSVIAQQRTISRLDSTDRIACAFIQADARTRERQSANSASTIAAELVYLHQIGNVLKLLTSAKPRPATIVIRDYLAQERTVWATEASNQQKNITLAREIARRGKALAHDLGCA